MFQKVAINRTQNQATGCEENVRLTKSTMEYDCDFKGKLIREGNNKNYYYLLKSKIGEGSSSTVWKAQQKPTGKDVAVKQIFLSKLNSRLKASMDCEINFLSSVNHPNIVHLLHFFQVKMNLLILFYFLFIFNLDMFFFNCFGS